MAFSSAFQANAFQQNAFQVVVLRGGAGDIATPAEIAFLRRRDRIRAWQIARQERQLYAKRAFLTNVIDMALRGPGAANPLDAAGKERAPVEASEQVKKPVGVPVTEYAHSALAETLEKDITPAPALPPSPESGQRIAAYATNVKALYEGELFARQQMTAATYVRLKAQLDADQGPAVAELLKPQRKSKLHVRLDDGGRSSGEALAALAAFSAEQSEAQADARRRLASFR
jgi:hypothetical protein